MLCFLLARVLGCGKGEGDRVLGIGHWGEGKGDLTGFISLLIPFGIAGDVLGLLLLLVWVLVAALEHLFEELELGGGDGEEGCEG